MFGSDSRKRSRSQSEAHPAASCYEWSLPRKGLRGVPREPGGRTQGGAAQGQEAWVETMGWRRGSDGKGRRKDGDTNGCRSREHRVPSTRRVPHTVAITDLNRPKELLICHSTGAPHFPERFLRVPSRSYLKSQPSMSSPWQLRPFHVLRVLQMG